MTYKEFEKKYLGKAVDFDGVAGRAVRRSRRSVPEGLLWDNRRVVQRRED